MEFVLPTDVVVADKFAPDANTQTVEVTAIPDGWMVSRTTSLCRWFRLQMLPVPLLALLASMPMLLWLCLPQPRLAAARSPSFRSSCLFLPPFYTRSCSDVAGRC